MDSNLLVAHFVASYTIECDDFSRFFFSARKRSCLDESVSTSFLSKVKFSNSDAKTPSKDHLTTDKLLNGFNACGTSPKAPVASPSMIDRTMKHGPTANAVSEVGAIAETAKPNAAELAACKANAETNFCLPAGFKPTIGETIIPNATGKSISIGVSTNNFAKKYAPGWYPPTFLRISRRTTKRSRGKLFNVRHNANMPLLMQLCIKTLTRRFTVDGCLEIRKLHDPNAVASPTEATSRTPLTHISRRVCFQLRPTSS
mmetsp:Transcript_2293/g.7272  ORF Transcript_2293/g.7272 Transcript_2293/m.7272 type:complete len:258 (+) Transcript_2293:1654-2427(+)